VECNPSIGIPNAKELDRASRCCGDRCKQTHARRSRDDEKQEPGRFRFESLCRTIHKRTAAEQILNISNPVPAIPDGNIENSFSIDGMLTGCGDLSNPEKRIPQSSIWMIGRSG
jgi:hypothetical protein